MAASPFSIAVFKSVAITALSEPKSWIFSARSIFFARTSALWASSAACSGFVVSSVSCCFCLSPATILSAFSKALITAIPCSVAFVNSLVPSFSTTPESWVCAFWTCAWGSVWICAFWTCDWGSVWVCCWAADWVLIEEAWTSPSSDDSACKLSSSCKKASVDISLSVNLLLTLSTSLVISCIFLDAVFNSLFNDLSVFETLIPSAKSVTLEETVFTVALFALTIPYSSCFVFCWISCVSVFWSCSSLLSLFSSVFSTESSAVTFLAASSVSWTAVVKFNANSLVSVLTEEFTSLSRVFVFLSNSAPFSIAISPISSFVKPFNDADTKPLLSKVVPV